MMKVQAKRLSKPTIIIVMLIALTLICGVIFASVSFTRNVKAEARMSVPSSGYNTTYAWSSSDMIDYSTQSSMTTISSTSFTQSAITDFSGADNHTKYSGTYTGNGFSGNSWVYSTMPSGSDVLHRLAFFHTFKLTEEVYANIANGTATVTVSKGGDLAFSGSAYDVRVATYASIGTAGTEADAKSYANFTEIRYAHGGMSSPQANNTNLNSTFSGLSLTPSNFTNTAIISTEKYLRVGVFFEIWPGSNSSGNGSLSGVKLNVTVSHGTPTMNLPTGNHSASGNIGYFNNGSTQERVVQDDIQTLSLTSTPSATNFTCVDNTAWIIANTNSALASGNKFNSTKNGWTTSVNATGTMFHPGFMYTYKIDDSLYEAIKGGTVKVSTSVSGNISLTKEDNRLFMYVGIGTSSSDNLAKTFAGFTQKAYDIDITNDGASSGYLDAAYNICSNGQGTISKIFNNATMVTNSNTEYTYKYLRVACFFETWSDVAQTITYSNMSMSVNLKEVPTPGNLMSNPGTVFTDGSTNAGDNNGWNAQNDDFHEKNTQSSLGDALSGTGYWTRDKKTQYTLVEDMEDTNGFLDSTYPGWRYYPSGAYSNMMFMHTFKLSDALYRGIIDGTYYVELQATNVWTAINNGSGYVANWGYVGIGNAKSDAAAMTYEGFKETSSVIGQKKYINTTKYANNGMNTVVSNNAITTNLKSGASQTLNEGYSSGTKYLRVALFGEAYSTNAQICMDSVVLVMYIKEANTTNTTAPSGISMTKPSGFSEQTLYWGANNSSGSFYQQGGNTTSPTILTAGAGHSASVGSYNAGTDYMYTTVSSNSSGGFQYNNKYSSSNNNPTWVGFFYTYKISEQTYNELIGGKIKVSLSTSSSMGGSAAFTNFSYLGIGYGASGYSPLSANGFVEMLGYIGPSRKNDGSQSASTNDISGFSFTNATSRKMVSNNNTKYIRFGYWCIYTGTASSINMSDVGATFSMTRDNSNAAPYISSGVTNGYANGPVTIKDTNGINYITVNGVSRYLAKYTNTEMPTEVKVNASSNGQTYSVTVVDLAGNSSSVSFTYFAPIIKVNGYTDGVEDDYSGGGIGLAFGSDTGGGTVFAQLYQKTTSGTIFYVYAKPNDGYYFAGFTNDAVFNTSYNTELTTSNGNYVRDTNNIEYAYKYTLNVPSSFIPLDGVIKVQAYFKSIPTTGAGSYEYDKESKTLSVTDSELANVINADNMASSVTYNNSASSAITTPINVDTYTVISYVTWYGQTVGKKTETIIITPKNITADFEVTEIEKTYDGTTSWSNTKVSYAWSSIVPSDEQSLSLAYNAVLSSKDVGSVDVLVSGLVFTGVTVDGYDISKNYTLTTTDATLVEAVNINPKAVTVTFTTTDKDYDGNNVATVNTPTIVGVVDGEGISYNDLSATYENKNAGENKKVTLTNPTATFADGTLSNNYIITTNADNLVATISKIQLTVSYSVTSTKIYDGETTAEVFGVEISGYIGDDNENLSPSVIANYDDANVSNNVNISIAIDVTGTESGNYYWSESATTPGIIEVRRLTITALDNTKVYGESDPTFAYSVSEPLFVNATDEENANMVLTRVEGEDVNVYDIKVSFDNSNNNYFLTAVNGKFTITKRPVTVTLRPQGGVYGDDLSVDSTQFDVSSSEGYEYLGDDLGISITKEGDMQVGAHALSATSSNKNHDVRFVIEYDFVITKRDLVIALDSTQGSVYGEAIVVDNTAFTAPNLASGDQVEIIITKAEGVIKGNYLLTGALDAESEYYDNITKNYNVSFGTDAVYYVISAREITIILAPQESIYGDEIIVDDTMFSVDTTSGKNDLASGEDKSILAVDIVKEEGLGAKEYALSFTWNNDNYVVNGENGVYTIKKATIIATYAGETITYGDIPVGEVVYSGFKYTDNEENAISQKASVDFSSLARTGEHITANISGYEGLIPAGAEADNYEFSYVAGVLVVEKAKLSVEYNEEITYGGTPVTDIASAKFIVSGLKTGDSASVLTAVASLPSNAGAHSITDSELTFTAINYEVASVEGTLIINKAPLEITVRAPSGLYYGDKIELNVTYGSVGKNFVNGESAEDLDSKVSVDFSIITNEKGHVNVGTGSYELENYVIKATSSNYEITHVIGKLTITKKNLNFAYVGEAKVYDTLLPVPSKSAVTVKESDFAEGENLDYLVETEGFSYDLAVIGAKKDVDAYEVYATNVATLKNYAVSFARGNYTITKAPLTISYDGQTITFGETPQELISYNGFKDSETSDVLTTAPHISFEDISAVTIIGENSYINANAIGYELTPTGAQAKNYEITIVSGTLIVNKRSASVTLKDQTSVYGKNVEVNQGSDYYTVSGLIEDDSLTAITINKEAGVTVGNYKLSAEVVAPNYEVTVEEGAKYVITKATLVVTIVYNAPSIIDIEVPNLTTDSFTVSYATFAYTDDDSMLDNPVTVDVDALIASVSEAGEYDIKYFVGEDDQYEFDYSGVGTIIVVASEKDVDISGLSFSNVTLDYNGENRYIEVTWENQPTEVEVEISYTYSKEPHKDAGKYGVTATFTVKTAGYKNNIAPISATLTIRPLDVELVLFAQECNYGEEIFVDQEAYSVNGTIIGTDNLGIVITKSAVMNATHGEYDLTATISNTNYNLVNVVGSVYVVKPLDVTVTLLDQEGAYGKTATVDQTKYEITSGSLVNESDLVIALSVESRELYEVGENYVISAEITPNPWYNFTIAEASYTVKVRAIQITLVNKTAYYGDVVSAETSYNFTIGSLAFEGDDLGLAFNLTHVEKYVVNGDYTISATASNANYSVDVVSAKYVVLPKEIKAIVSNQSSTYGQSYVIVDEFELAEGYALAYDDEKDDLGVRVSIKEGFAINAGTYELVANASNANYTVEFESGSYVIGKATTILYTDKLKKEYNYTGSAINFKTATSYVYSNREESQANIKLPTTSVVNAGTYTVTFSINESTNYLAASVSVEIIVNKIAPEVNLNSLLSAVYIYNGEEQTIRVSDSELLAKADKDEVVVSWSNDKFTNVPEGGVQVVEVTLSETTNYIGKTFTQNVRVYKARYSFEGLDYRFDAITTAYNGMEHYVEVINLPSGITASYSYEDQIQTEPFRFKNAGTYVVKAIYSYDEVNYERPTEFIDSSSVQITRINITVDVVDQSGYYGDEPVFDPEGVQVIAGNFVEGDEINLKLELEPKDSYPIGVYKLVANTMSSGNYNVTIASGSYTIKARPITITVNNESGEYGDADKPFTFSITTGELVAGDELTSKLVREEGKVPGQYVIDGEVVNPNYAVTVIPGIYTITPRKITIEVFNQEGTSEKQINKKAYKTYGKVVRGDNLNIQVVGEIGTTPGEYVLTATFAENMNYEITVLEGVFTLRKVSKISVSNLVDYKLYDGTPYVFDASVSSGAMPIFSIDGIFVENAFTEVGVYNIAINAEVVGDYASPDAYRFTFEIRPTELTAEKDGIIFKVTKEDGFKATDELEVEYDPSITLSGSDYTSKIDSAFTIYVVQEQERVPLEEYMQGEEVYIKVRLNEQLTEIGAETWFVDSSNNVLHEASTPDEEGYVEVLLTDGNHVLFVTERDEATPILVVGSGMAVIFMVMGFFFLFRKKFIN